MQHDLLKVVDNEIAFFDKPAYADPPDPRLRMMIENLRVLGKAVIVVRDGEEIVSSNIVATLFVGDDGGDPVVRGNVPPLGECACHVHVKWNEVYACRLTRENVGYGAEAVMYLLGRNGQTLLRFFFPKKTFEEVHAVFIAEEAITPEPQPKPFRFVFAIRFLNRHGREAYMEFWREISVLIQQEPGSLGTILHLTEEPLGILAIATWTSRAARAEAYGRLNTEHDLDNKVRFQIAALDGEVVFVSEGEEIDMVVAA